MRKRMRVGSSTTKIFGQVYLLLALRCAKLWRDTKTASRGWERQRLGKNAIEGAPPIF